MSGEQKRVSSEARLNSRTRPGTLYVNDVTKRRREPLASLRKGQRTK